MNNSCFFCQKGINEIAYNDLDLLKRFISSQAKIISPKRTGVCAKHQRKLARAVKQSRHLGLLPVTAK